MCSSGQSRKKTDVDSNEKKPCNPKFRAWGGPGGILHMEQATKLPRCPEMRKVFATNKLEI